ncbi:MAG: HrpE/YscL family type III secretion apparatus protein [bacterium]
MEVKLDSLIEKIRKEAVDEGRKQALELVENAQLEAKTIVQDAEEKARSILEKAKIQAEKTHENTILALQQAARDIELSLKERITNLFDRVFKQAVGDVLQTEFLENLILTLVKEWSSKGAVDIMVNPETQKNLERTFFAKLGETLKESVTLSALPGLAKGFRVALKDGSLYYDFSDETIAETMKEFLSPTLRSLLDKNNG